MYKDKTVKSYKNTETSIEKLRIEFKSFKQEWQKIQSPTKMVVGQHQRKTHDIGTSMKVGEFSRPPHPSYPATFKMFPPPCHWTSSFKRSSPAPNYNQSIKRKLNPRMTIACYQVFPSGRPLFSVSTHYQVWLSIDFYPFS